MPLLDQLGESGERGLMVVMGKSESVLLLWMVVPSVTEGKGRREGIWGWGVRGFWNLVDVGHKYSNII